MLGLNTPNCLSNKEVPAKLQLISNRIIMFVLGGSHDFLTPLSVLEQDQQFDRKNIEMVCIPNAGHFPWVE